MHFALDPVRGLETGRQRIDLGMLPIKLHAQRDQQVDVLDDQVVEDLDMRSRIDTGRDIEPCAQITKDVFRYRYDRRRLDFDISFVWDRIEDPKTEADGQEPKQDNFYTFLGIGFEL